MTQGSGYHGVFPIEVGLWLRRGSSTGAGSLAPVSAKKPRRRACPGVTQNSCALWSASPIFVVAVASMFARLNVRCALTEMGPNEAAEFRYLSREMDEKTLDREIDRFWTELQDDPELQQELRDEGIPVDQLLGIDRRQAITIRRGKAGLGAATTAIIVAFAPVAAGITRDLWKRVLLPRIERRFGVGILKEESE